MEHRTPHGFRALVLPTLVVLLSIAAAGPAGAARSSTPTVDIHTAGGLAPDGRSIGVQVLASCPERWTVVEAVVRVSQPQASGEASFPLTCIGSIRNFAVQVPAAVGTFELGTAQVTASVVIKRGRTARADDSDVVRIDPLVEVILAETAQLIAGGISIGVTVACPVGTTGLRSNLNVSQGQTSANGSYTPVCDGTRHTFGVTVSGSYQPGTAQALTFADVEYNGDVFVGVDDGPIQIVG